MSDGTSIEWTDATWNPVTGCSIVSPGCTNCYAMRLAGTRLKHHPSRAGLTVDTKAGPVWNGQVRFNEGWLSEPLKWKRARRIFVCAHGDLFAEGVKDEWIDQVFAVMALAPQHQFQVLTKRPGRMRDYLLERWQPAKAQTYDFGGEPFEMPAEDVGETRRDQVLREADRLVLALDLADTDNDKLWTADGALKLMQFGWPLPNVWLGVSVEDQKRADERIPVLLDTPAAVRFISAEPLLGPIDLRQWQHDYGCGCGWGGDDPLDYCRHCGWRGRAEGEEVAGPCSECGGTIDDYYACPECDGHDGDGVSFGPNSRPRLNWVIVGGESGPGARPMHTNWATDLRDQCAAAGVPFFFKQWGAWLPNGELLDGGERFTLLGKKYAGRLLDGVEHNGMPEVGTGVP